MKPVNRADTRIERTACGWTALLLGLPFAAVGAFFTLTGLGSVPLLDTVNGPLRPVASVGLADAALARPARGQS